MFTGELRSQIESPRSAPTLRAALAEFEPRWFATDPRRYGRPAARWHHPTPALHHQIASLRPDAHAHAPNWPAVVARWADGDWVQHRLALAARHRHNRTQPPDPQRPATTSALARLVGETPGTLARKLRGESVASLVDLAAVVRALDLEPGWLGPAPSPDP